MSAPELSRMSWGAHFSALRKALVYSILALAAGTMISMSFLREIWTFLLAPMPAGASHVLHNLKPSDALLADFKVSLWAGGVLSSPVIFWQLWLFLAPALFRNQQKTVFWTSFLSVLFFLFGTAFAYVVVIPLCLAFFYGYSKGLSDPTWTQESYLDFVINFLLTFGLVFQIPVASQLLARFGLLQSSFLVGQWRIVVILIFIIAALLSPPDLLSQFLIAIPMLFLYMISIFWVRAIEGRLAKQAARPNN